MIHTRSLFLTSIPAPESTLAISHAPAPESTLSAIAHTTTTSIIHPNDPSALSAPISSVPMKSVSFETVKAVLASHHLPQGVLCEIQNCINEDVGFEKSQWLGILEENMVSECLMSTILTLMHELSATITGEL